MKECPTCKANVDSLLKVKLWWLISQKCKTCGRELKLNKNQLFPISINTIIIAVILIFVLNNLGINLLLNGVIVLAFGILVPMPFIIYFVDFQK